MRTMVRLKTKGLDWGAELIGVMLDKFGAALVVQLSAFRRNAVEIKAFGVLIVIFVLWLLMPRGSTRF